MCFLLVVYTFLVGVFLLNGHFSEGKEQEVVGTDSAMIYLLAIQ